MFGNKNKKVRERLEAEGVRAQATVLEISGGHVSVTMGNPQVVSSTEIPMKLKLRVEPDGEEAFEVKTKMSFPQMGIPREGGTIPVIFNPSDHDELILDQSTGGGLSMAAGMLRGRADSEGRPELDSVADIVEQASAGGTLDIEAMQRQLREQFGGAAASGSANLAAFGLGAAAQPQAPDPLDQLEKLGDLRDRGVLSEEEFQAQKARILGEG